MSEDAGRPETEAGLGALDRAWEEAASGTIVVHNVVGPPGGGKTGLVDVWLSRSEPSAVLRAWVPYEPAVTFGPLADVIEQAAGIGRDDGIESVRAKLGALGDLDRDVVRRTAHVVGDRSSVFPNHEIFWATRLLLEHLSRREPLVVIWEGLERAEPTFLDMLEYLAGRPGRVLVVTTAREELLRTRPHWARDGDSPLRSARLSKSGEPVSPLDGLSRGETSVLEAIAVAGEAFDEPFLRTIVGETDGLASAVEGLERAGLVRQRPGCGGRWTLASGVLRDEIHEGLSVRFAAAVHERIAVYLEAASQDRAPHDEAIAFHLEFAAEHVKPNERKALANRAVGRLAASGRRALARSDAPAAVDLLERGAVLIDDADTRRPRLLLSLCDALLDLGDVQRIRRIAETGLKEARDVDDAMAAARFDVWRQVALAQLDPSMAMPDLAEELRIAQVMERSGERLGAAEAYQLYAGHLWEIPDHAGAEEALDKALVNARAANHSRLESKVAAWLLFSFFWGPGPVASGIERCEGFAGDFSADRLLEANRLTTLGGLHGLAGDSNRARALIMQAREIQVELGQPLVISWNPQIGATVALVNGELGWAEEEARLAFQEAQHMADPGHAATGASLLAKVLYAQGRSEESFQYTRLAERASLGAPEAAQGEWRCTRAKIDARSGDVERSIAEIRGALDFLDGGAMPRDRADALADLAEVLRAAGRGDDEKKALEEALALYEAKGVLPAVAGVRKRIDELS